MNPLAATFPQSFSLLAHPGHPGPAGHGDGTHALLSLGISLLVLGGAWLLLRARRLRQSPAAVRRENSNG
jgi:hypothetical protein